ncbi:MAG: GntG family PLP-dependent aldolase [Candidatus Eremiobacteraeota bacterium]|nr:GntG family PLP-dependent aldolase [Candidatus Eremiobacteraeota bacterium]
MEMINLYSDTQTLPTEEMYDAMRRAPLGDDMMGMDPTVNELEERASALFGKEAALFVTSGTMGNLCGLMALAGPGDEVIIDPESHIWFYEAGAFCSMAGLTPRPVPSRVGLLDPAEVKGAIRPRNLHMPTPRVLCLENTHNRGQGRVTPLELHRALCETAHQEGLAVHLDGARIFNAQVATGVPAAEYAKTVESLTFCLSKGLSCPVGSLVVGDRPFIERARRVRKRLGGAMRQAGILAACGIVALSTMIERLSKDHANAKLLAGGLARLPGFSIDMERVETNMVYVDISGTGIPAKNLAEKLKEKGVMASVTAHSMLRFVTHRHITGELVKEAVARAEKIIHEECRCPS